MASILEKIGLDKSRLRCGKHLPADWSAQHIPNGCQADVLQNNCSGKHAGMLAMCVAGGFDIKTYDSPDHPVQQEILRTIAQFIGASPSEVLVGVENCGAPVFGVSVVQIAFLYSILANPERQPKTRVFYLDQFFERAFQIFNQAWAAEFEQELYEGVEQGKLTSADDLNALMTCTGSRYSIWFGMDDDSKRDWINIPHYFRSPLYRVNYLYARLLALKYFEAYKREPESFAPRYLSLLRNGYDAPPDVLLKQFLSIDMRGDQLVSDVLAILGGKLPELEATYSK